MSRHSLIDASTLASDVEGNPVKVSRGEYLACYAAWSGTDSPSGSIKWQYSHDFVPGRESSATWTDLEKEGSGVTFGTAPDGSGAGSTAEIFEDLTGWVRPVYVADSGGTGATLVVTAERGHR